MRIMNRSVGVFALSGCLVACGSTPLRSPQAQTPPTVSHRREATVIYVPEGTLHAAGATTWADVTCPAPESGGFAPLLIPLAGVATDALVAATSSLLSRAKDNRTATWSATLGGVPLQAGRHYCLAISRGMITDVAEGQKSAALDQSLRFDGVPAFVLFADLAVSGSTDPSKAVIFTLRPKFLSYADTAAPSRGKKKKDVSILLSFNGVAKVEVKPVKPEAETGGGAATVGATKPPVTPVGGKPADPPKDGTEKTPSTVPPANALRLDFGRLEIGSVYTSALLIPTEASVSVDSGGLFTVTAVVTESEDPDVALSALASGFDSHKDDLSAALKKALGVPTVTKK